MSEVSRATNASGVGLLSLRGLIDVEENENSGLEQLDTLGENDNERNLGFSCDLIAFFAKLSLLRPYRCDGCVLLQLAHGPDAAFSDLRHQLEWPKAW